MSRTQALLTVDTGDYARVDQAAVIRLNALQAPFEKLHLVERDARGQDLDAAVPFQLDADDVGTTDLTFLLKGITPANTRRYYALVAGDRPLSVERLVTLTDDVIYQEQASYQIATPGAAYLYHKQGAGFASMIDSDGADWLSYRPFGGSDGKYRGIPNLAHPENHLHPGGTGCASRIVSSGPVMVKIASESLDGKWACEWAIFSTYARLTVLKVDHPYWFLYEGTPGGVLNESEDYCVRSDGLRRPLSERWAEPLPDPEWIYFGTASANRVLYLAHHESDDHIDSFWPMENNMTVFGFGRNGLEKYMTQTPAHFTIGFAESADFASVQRIIDSAVRPLAITVT